MGHFNVTHRRRQNLYKMPSTEWGVLAAPPFNFLATLDQVDNAIDTNAEIACEILNTGIKSFGIQDVSSDGSIDWHGSAAASDLDKARSSIRQLYRDWSTEGETERRASYGPILDDLSKYFTEYKKSTLKILVPGAGLGRLCFDLCIEGYDVEGNELSYHSLLTSSWVLNQTERAEQFDLCPFAFEFSNVIRRADQLKTVKIPDIHPAKALEDASLRQGSSTSERLRMVAADFVSLYGSLKLRECFDVVVTVFFIDTSRNVLKYIQVIHNTLKLGGLWINHGPLLWHCSDREEAHPKSNVEPTVADDNGGITDHGGSVELCLEEIFSLVGSMGFRIETTSMNYSSYTQNPDSMLQNIYKTAYWVARKIK